MAQQQGQFTGAQLANPLPAPGPTQELTDQQLARYAQREDFDPTKLTEAELARLPNLLSGGPGGGRTATNPLAGASGAQSIGPGQSQMKDRLDTAVRTAIEAAPQTAGMIASFIPQFRTAKMAFAVPAVVSALTDLARGDIDADTFQDAVVEGMLGAGSHGVGRLLGAPQAANFTAREASSPAAVITRGMETEGTRGAAPSMGRAGVRRSLGAAGGRPRGEIAQLRQTPGGRARLAATGTNRTAAEMDRLAGTAIRENASLSQEGIDALNRQVIAYSNQLDDLARQVDPGLARQWTESAERAALNNPAVKAKVLEVRNRQAALEELIPVWEKAVAEAGQQGSKPARFLAGAAVAGLGLPVLMAMGVDPRMAGLITLGLGIPAGLSQSAPRLSNRAGQLLARTQAFGLPAELLTRTAATVSQGRQGLADPLADPAAGPSIGPAPSPRRRTPGSRR